MVTEARQRLIFDQSQRQRFLHAVKTYAGDDVRLLWSPKPTDLTVTYDEVGNKITWDGAPASRITALGQGYQQSFDGVGNFGQLADAPHFTFGTGAADQPFSIIFFGNITNTAAAREILTKYSGGPAQREYLFRLESTDLMALKLYDESVDVEPNKTTDAAIGMGANHLWVATYSGVGGATAGAGINIYQDGVLLAATANEQATYVAMENLTSVVNIGARGGGANSPYAGTMALLAEVGGVVGAAIPLVLTNLHRQFFGNF